MSELRALLLTDLVGSTQFAARLGDVRAAEFWREHDRRARSLLASHAGREIDHSDGFLLLFLHVADAIGYALAYHESLADLAVEARAGIHFGAVTLRENAAADVALGAKPIEVEGIAKPLGGRVMSLARGGQTLITADARQALGDALPSHWAVRLHGHYRLAGFEEPVELSEVGVAARCPFVAPADADKAYRVVRANDLWLPVREVRHNLPAECNAFVGRIQESRSLTERLDAEARQITVIGAAGAGKTRFLCRYGWTHLGDWPGGTYFCDLSECRSLEGVYFAVALALGVPLAKEDPAEQLGHAIASRGRCLVILDNFEQIVDLAPASLGRWLQRSAKAFFVVSSRERLCLPGEELLAIEPLPISQEAIQLFVVRARAQKPDFALNELNRPVVERIVSLLDGLPLAIELAAARTRLFSPTQLVERLRDRFAVLGGIRATDARRTTLRAAIDWSWDLLSPAEQAALAQASTFEGAFDLEAVEAVLDLSLEPQGLLVIDAIQALVDKSLIRVSSSTASHDDRKDEAHLGLLRSIHEYAAQRLRASGPGAMRAVEERHGRYYAAFGSDRFLDELSQHGGTARCRGLVLAIDNVVAACRRAVQRGDGPTAVATYRAAWAVFDLQGPFETANALGAEVLAIEGLAPAAVAATHMTRALGSWRAGRVAEAQTAFERAHALFVALGDRRQAGRVLGHLGTCSREQGRMQEAQEQLEAALATARETHDRLAEGALNRSLALLHYEQGRLEAARGLFEEAIRINRERGDRRAEAIVLNNLATLHNEQGRMADAFATLESATELLRGVGDRAGEGQARANLGLLNFRDGRMDQCMPHFESALAIHRELGDRRNEGIALGNLGCALGESGRIDEARTHLDSALDIHRQLRNRRFEAIVLADLGALLGSRGDFEAALGHQESALAIHLETGDRRGQGIVLGYMADLLIGQSRYADAKQALLDAEVRLREVGDRMRLVLLLCSRARAEAATGRRALAEAALVEADALEDSVHASRDTELARTIAETRQALGMP